MRNSYSNLPSPAMAVAFVALLAALTGTAVALPGSNSVTSGDIKNGAVGTSDIKNNSVRGADIRNGTIGGGDIRNNSLKGDDVDESSLGTVARASAANSAATAGSANTAGFAGNAGAVDGASIADINFRAAEETPNTTIFDQGGLRLVANCISDDLEVNAINTTSAVASMYVDGIDPNDAPDYEEFDQFDPGAGNQIGIEFYPDDNDLNQTVYFSAAGGANVTAHLHWEENAQISPGSTGCAVTGYAVIS